jgi:hypothetical protein
LGSTWRPLRACASRARHPARARSEASLSARTSALGARKVEQGVSRWRSRRIGRRCVRDIGCSRHRPALQAGGGQGIPRSARRADGSIFFDPSPFLNDEGYGE